MSSTATRIRIALRFLAIVTTALALSGCGLMSHIGHTHTASSAENRPLGERPGSVPAAERGGGGASPSPTPSAALLRFAALYINWTSKNLTNHERTLAKIAVGGARLAEQQAAAQNASDTEIARAHIYNRGRVIAIAPVNGEAKGRYAIVTREETGGSAEYAGLQAAYHVTLAAIKRLSDGGFAVSDWEPES